PNPAYTRRVRAGGADAGIEVGVGGHSRDVGARDGAGPRCARLGGDTRGPDPALRVPDALRGGPRLRASAEGAGGGARRSRSLDPAPRAPGPAGPAPLAVDAPRPARPRRRPLRLVRAPEPLRVDVQPAARSHLRARHAGEL